MTPSDFDAFVELMSITAEQYGKTLSDGLMGLYWQALQPYELGAVRSALSAHITNPDTGMFMPKIADIVRMISGRTEDRALAAWSKVDRAVRVIGPYRDVVFDDPAVHVVLVDMGGWSSLGQKTEDEWPFIRNEFVTRYRGLMTTQREIDRVPALIGIANASNAASGGNYALSPPVPVGQLDGASAVLNRVTRIQDGIDGLSIDKRVAALTRRSAG